MTEDVIITQTNRVIIFQPNCALPSTTVECVSKSQVDTELMQAMQRKNCGNGSIYYLNGYYYATAIDNIRNCSRFRFL
jgi:hypothetical protein